jgi:hypothetical protein
LLSDSFKLQSLHTPDSTAFPAAIAVVGTTGFPTSAQNASRLQTAFSVAVVQGPLAVQTLLWHLLKELQSLSFAHFAPGLPSHSKLSLSVSQKSITPYSQPILLKDRTETVDPAEAQSKTDIVLANLVKPNILKDDPNRANDRIDNALPSETKSSTLKLLPKRNIPKTDMLDPKRENERTDNADPS